MNVKPKPKWARWTAEQQSRKNTKSLNMLMFRKNVLYPNSVWLNPVQVDGEVIRRKESVSYTGSSDGIRPIFHNANDQIQTYFPPTPSLQHLNQCENLKNYYQGRNWGGCALDGGAYWLRGHTYLPCSSSPLGCPLIAKNCHLLMRTVLTLTAWPLGWPCGVNTQDPSIM